MSTNSVDIDTILNGNGGKIHRRGVSRRMHSTTISFKGCEIDVQYLTDGQLMPATDTDPAEYPVCLVQVVEIGGQDVTRLLSEQLDGIAEAVESQWRAS